MPEIRVTINENLDSFIGKLVESGIYPSKAELLRCGLTHLLKDLGLLPTLVATNKAGASKRK